MRTVATLGSCLSGLTGVMLAGDYRWVRLNNAVVDRSDLFVKYFLRRERMPSREIVEMLLEVKPEHAEWTKQLFQRMFRETAGLADLPPETTPLFDNLESKRFDLFVLDNQHDTHNIKCTYRSLDGRLDFEFNFPLHWCERHDLMQDSFHWSPCLEPAESAQCWAEIVRYLRAAQPAAHIVFLCASSSTIAHDPARCARADGFPAALRDALGDDGTEIVPQLHVPRELSKLPDDIEHFDLAIYRALAGRVFTSYLMATRMDLAQEAVAADAA